MQIGDVVYYDYLYSWEVKFETDGEKNRPCMVYLLQGSKIFLTSISHVSGSLAKFPVPVPPKACKRLGLDNIPQWIISSELNRLDANSCSSPVGTLSSKTVAIVINRVAQHLSSGNLFIVDR